MRRPGSPGPAPTSETKPGRQRRGGSRATARARRGRSASRGAAGGASRAARARASSRPARPPRCRPRRRDRAGAARRAPRAAGPRARARGRPWRSRRSRRRGGPPPPCRPSRSRGRPRRSRGVAAPPRPRRPPGSPPASPPPRRARRHRGPRRGMRAGAPPPLPRRRPRAPAARPRSPGRRPPRADGRAAPPSRRRPRRRRRARRASRTGGRAAPSHDSSSERHEDANPRWRTKFPSSGQRTRVHFNGCGRRPWGLLPRARCSYLIDGRTPMRVRGAVAALGVWGAAVIASAGAVAEEAAPASPAPGACAIHSPEAATLASAACVACHEGARAGAHSHPVDRSYATARAGSSSALRDPSEVARLGIRLPDGRAALHDVPRRRVPVGALHRPPSWCGGAGGLRCARPRLGGGDPGADAESGRRGVREAAVSGVSRVLMKTATATGFPEAGHPERSDAASAAERSRRTPTPTRPDPDLDLDPARTPTPTPTPTYRGRSS